MSSYGSVGEDGDPPAGACGLNITLSGRLGSLVRTGTLSSMLNTWRVRAWVAAYWAGAFIALAFWLGVLIGTLMWPGDGWR